MEVIIKLSDRVDKRYVAVFYNKDKKVGVSSPSDDRRKKGKTTHFGFAITGEGGKKYGSTYIDHKNDAVKDAWISRHKVNGTFDDYMSASSLARYILWNKKSLKESIAEYKSLFRLE